jgi:hypothetical protein
MASIYRKSEGKSGPDNGNPTAIKNKWWQTRQYIRCLLAVSKGPSSIREPEIPRGEKVAIRLMTLGME